MGSVADAAVGPVGVKLAVVGHLGSHLLCRFASGCAAPELVGEVGVARSADGVAVDGFGECQAVGADGCCVDQGAVGQLFHNGEDAACAVDILNMVG